MTQRRNKLVKSWVSTWSTDLFDGVVIFPDVHNTLVNFIIRLADELWYRVSSKPLSK
jgi:hypothetical protein